MKRAKVVFNIAGAVMLGFCALSMKAAQNDFSGTWVLDKENVKGVPHNLSYTIVVRQDKQQLVVDTDMENIQDTADNGQQKAPMTGVDTPRVIQTKPPTGGGMSGAPYGSVGGVGSVEDSKNGSQALMTAVPEATYSLDGKKTTANVPGIGDLTFKAKWAKDGKSLELSMVHTEIVNELNASVESKERWTLSEDGQVLKLLRTVTFPGGTDTITLKFRKKTGAH